MKPRICKKSRNKRNRSQKRKYIFSSEPNLKDENQGPGYDEPGRQGRQGRRFSQETNEDEKFGIVPVSPKKIDLSERLELVENKLEKVVKTIEHLENSLGNFAHDLGYKYTPMTRMKEFLEEEEKLDSVDYHEIFCDLVRYILDNGFNLSFSQYIEIGRTNKTSNPIPTDVQISYILSFLEKLLIGIDIDKIDVYKHTNNNIKFLPFKKNRRIIYSRDLYSFYHKIDICKVIQKFPNDIQTFNYDETMGKKYLNTLDYLEIEKDILLKHPYIKGQINDSDCRDFMSTFSKRRPKISKTYKD
jgi:hypothetical protein